ncbi:hypothetical protein SASPL_133582 [Salvia splendens]|uniref:Uncharacterized protein n=1 Tax=Salvia splendens TaxID=180675 RepID=A0A8X8ZIG9_SALSN|nr:hypothetical protein SASPL_133582 [Salvia splendens]
MSATSLFLHDVSYLISKIVIAPELISSVSSSIAPRHSSTAEAIENPFGGTAVTGTGHAEAIVCHPSAHNSLSQDKSVSEADDACGSAGAGASDKAYFMHRFMVSPASNHKLRAARLRHHPILFHQFLQFVNCRRLLLLLLLLILPVGTLEILSLEAFFGGERHEGRGEEDKEEDEHEDLLGQEGAVVEDRPRPDDLNADVGDDGEDENGQCGGVDENVWVGHGSEGGDEVGDGGGHEGEASDLGEAVGGCGHVGGEVDGELESDGEKGKEGGVEREEAGGEPELPGAAQASEATATYMPINGIGPSSFSFIQDSSLVDINSDVKSSGV